MTKLYTSDNNYRAYKALIASKYSGKAVTAVNDQPKCQINSGKLPVLELSDGSNLFDSNAIAFYLSNDDLRGSNDSTKAQVLQWLGFSNDLWPAVFAWVLPATGLSNKKQTLDQAKNEVNNYLKLLDSYLLKRTYLVGERITLADISVGVTLLPLYQNVLEPSLRQPLVNLNRYFTTLINQKEFSSVLGKVELCSKVKQLSASDAKPKAKKENEPKKPAPAIADDGDDVPVAPKPKDPFEKFPKGKFDMDDFKRFYSNNEEKLSIPYFWEKFDKENYSIWYGEYKYPEELTLVFMSCNLMSGMFQRLDRMRKHAFGSVCLFGEDHKSSISGIWVWRGHELAFTLHEDLQVDYESYEWKKLDPDAPETKKMVHEYFSWEGDFGGKKFNQGKIFK